MAIPPNIKGPPGQACVLNMAIPKLESASNTTGPHELLSGGKAGILVHPEDVDALAEALDGLINDEGMRGRLGQLGRDAVAHFSVNEVMSQWDELVHRVASSDTARRTKT